MTHVEYLLPWPARPLRCLVGWHLWRQHPSGFGWWYCRMCGAEKQTTR